MSGANALLPNEPSNDLDVENLNEIKRCAMVGRQAEIKLK